jgi:hypothetical protein
MKSRKLPTLAALIAASALSVAGQGTFIYDQQSSMDETPFPGTGGQMNQLQPPWGQSFAPAMALIDFIRLKFADAVPGGALGATVYVNLHSGSIVGPILAVTAPVVMRAGFAGVTNFFFPSSVSLTPGTTYYFEPVQSNGGPWNIDGRQYIYAGGAFIENGVAMLSLDLWFREGIYVVPEPALPLFLSLGVSAVVGLRRHRCYRSAVHS